MSGTGGAEPVGGVPDAGQRGAQVALDVDGERLERRDVEHPAALLLVLRRRRSVSSRSSDQRNAASVLPEPVGATTSACSPAPIASQAPDLGGGGSANAAANHVAGGLAEAVEGGGHAPIVHRALTTGPSLGLVRPFGRGFSGAGPPNRACWRALAAPDRTSVHAVGMTAVMLDETATVIRELARAAEAFAQRAQEQVGVPRPCASRHRRAAPTRALRHAVAAGRVEPAGQDQRAGDRTGRLTGACLRRPRRVDGTSSTW